MRKALLILGHYADYPQNQITRIIAESPCHPILQMAGRLLYLYYLIIIVGEGRSSDRQKSLTEKASL